MQNYHQMNLLCFSPANLSFVIWVSVMTLYNGWERDHPFSLPYTRKKSHQDENFPKVQHI
jgi:hypothetical protein